MLATTMPTTKKTPKSKESAKAGGPASAGKPAGRTTIAPKAAAPAKAAGKGAPAAKGSTPASKPGDPKDASKRKLGLRGAAPWAARHAAKHAAEARARAAEPPLPGSARATIRTPAKAEDIKAKIADLHNALAQIKGLRKNFHKTFYDVGIVLRDVQARKLYEAKGYGSFEAFLEREVEFGKTTGLRLVKVVGTFLKEAALDYGLDRLGNALIALEVSLDALGIPAAPPSGKIPPAPMSSPVLPLKPPGR
jgi:hypothetical protein